MAVYRVGTFEGHQKSTPVLDTRGCEISSCCPLAVYFYLALDTLAFVALAPAIGGSGGPLKARRVCWVSIHILRFTSNRPRDLSVSGLDQFLEPEIPSVLLQDLSGEAQFTDPRAKAVGEPHSPDLDKSTDTEAVKSLFVKHHMSTRAWFLTFSH